MSTLDTGLGRRPVPPHVRAAHAAEAHTIAVTLAEAALGDPLGRWLIPADEDTRFQYAVAFFRMLVDRGLTCGELMVTAGLEGAAIWDPRLPRNGHNPTVADYDTRLMETTGRYAPRFMTLDEQLAHTHPTEDHWYLIGLGVRPQHRGVGKGADLLLSMLSTLDAAAAPAAVHAYSDDARGFYERHGFTVLPVGPVTLPEDGPTVWPMWRGAQA